MTPVCDHCEHRPATLLCKSCGFRVCEYCRAHFEVLKDHWYSAERRCPECKRGSGWDPL